MLSTKNPQSVTEVDDACVSKEHVLTMLNGDDYLHERVWKVFAQAGFGVGYIAKDEEHPVWTILLKRTSFDLSSNTGIARKQLRNLLTDAGLKIEADEFNIFDRRGDRLRCVFIFSCGAPGVVC